MRIKVSNSLPRALHSEIKQIVRDAMHGVGTTGVEVHVKKSGTGDTGGYAYNGVPTIARVDKNVRYLITIRLSLTACYPITWRYPNRTTSPTFIFESWQEDLFHTAAHEAYHIKQFRCGFSLSENRAERWAMQRMIKAGMYRPGEEMANAS